MTVLPVTREILTRGAPNAVPRAFDVVRAPRSVDKTERCPDRMITSEDESVARSSNHRAHSAPISFDPCGPRVMEQSGVNRAPEVRVKLEIRHAPTLAHRAEYGFE